jgi:quercetin dioxygenase-like cupin family protein
MTDARVAPIVGHIDDASVPWVDAGDHEFKILRVERGSGERVLRFRFPPGFRAPRHRHTGHSYGYTTSGAWGYEEYGSRYEPGSFIHEPAGSVHTLIVFGDNTEPTDVLFISRGANLTLDDDDNVVLITDTDALLDGYYQLCDTAGLPRPTHIEI